MTKSILFPSAQDLLSSSTEMRWIVKPLLVPGSSMMVYGRQGVGKSTLLLQLSAALANEEDWLVFPTMLRGSTLWLQLDMPKMELRGLLMRAEQAKFLTNGTREAVKFAQFFDDTQEVFDFDILADLDNKLLSEAVLDLKPLCLMVDTGNDIFQGRQHKDAGSEVRKVVRRLRGAMGQIGGVCVYTQHQRKRQLGITGDDPDAFLGRVEWETVASSSLQLQSTSDDGDDTYTLVMRKHRLAEPGFRQLELTKDGFGFFHPKWTPTVALACWPRCVPTSLRLASSKDAVLDTLENHFKFDKTALKMAAQRMRGKVPW